MPVRSSPKPPLDPRANERGNIVLIAALIVLSLGLTGLGLSRFVQNQMSASSERMLSNYGATYAQNVAESEINYMLYVWDSTPGTSSFAPYVATYSDTAVAPAMTSLGTTYASYSTPANSTATYSVTVGSWSLLNPATVSVTVKATVASPQANSFWQSITRTVTVTIASSTLPAYPAGSPFLVQAYSR